MENKFENILDSIDTMELQEQQMIVNIVQNRIAEKKRIEIIKEVEQGRIDYKNGNVMRGGVKELLADIYE